MSALASPYQLVTVTVGWREPNGQVIEFGAGPGSLPVSTAGSSSGGSSSGSSGQGGQGGSPAGSHQVNLFV